MPPLFLNEGEQITIPPTGVRALFIDADATIKQVNSAGAKTAIGAAVPNVYATTLVAPADTLSVSGLLPATDGIYDVYAVLNIVQANGTVKIQPNALDTNCESQCSGLFVGATRFDTTWTIGQAAGAALQIASGNTVIMTGTLKAKTGRIRSLDLRWYIKIGAGTNNFGVFHGIYTDTATAIASLTLASAVANSYGVGSSLVLTSIPWPA